MDLAAITSPALFLHDGQLDKTHMRLAHYGRPLLGVAGGLGGDVLLVGVDAALAPPGDVLPRLLAELATKMTISAILPPGHAACGHSAPRPLVIAAREQEAGADASKVEVGEVTTRLQTRYCQSNNE